MYFLDYLKESSSLEAKNCMYRILMAGKYHNVGQSAGWSCWSEVKRIFRVGMWQWKKHGSTATHLKQKYR